MIDIFLHYRRSTLDEIQSIAGYFVRYIQRAVTPMSG